MTIFIHDLTGLFGFFDPRSGEVTGLGDFGQTITDVSFGHDGTLYAIDFNSLHIADPDSGTLDFVRTLPISQANSLATGFEPQAGTEHSRAFVGAGDGRWAQFYFETGEIVGEGSFPQNWQASGDIVGYTRDDGVREWIVAAQRGGGLIGPTHAFLRYIYDPDAPYIGTNLGVFSQDDDTDVRIVVNNHNVRNLWALAGPGEPGEPFFGFAGARAYEFELDPLSVRQIADLSGYGFVEIAGAARVVEPFLSTDANRPPVVEGANSVVLTPGTVLLALDFVTVTDPDGPDDIDFVRFWDATPGTDGGFLTLDGARIDSSFVDVALDDLTRVAYQAGPETGSNAIVIEAFDRAGLTSGDFELEFVIEAGALADLYRPTSADLEYLARALAYGRSSLSAEPDFRLHEAVLAGDWATYEALVPAFSLPDGYVIDRVFVEPGRRAAEPGFLGIGLTSETGEPILVMRGTTGALDWVDNLNAAGAGYRQVEAVWNDTGNFKGVRSWISELVGEDGDPLPVHITGHSQGGAQAQVIAARAVALDVPVGSVATFNSPGLPEGALISPGDAAIGSVDHFVSSGDVVSLVGNQFLPGTVTLYAVDYPDILEFAGFSNSLFADFNARVGGQGELEIASAKTRLEFLVDQFSNDELDAMIYSQVQSVFPLPHTGHSALSASASLLGASESERGQILGEVSSGVLSAGSFSFSNFTHPLDDGTFLQFSDDRFADMSQHVHDLLSFVAGTVVDGANWLRAWYGWGQVGRIWGSDASQTIEEFGITRELVRSVIEDGRRIQRFLADNDLLMRSEWQGGFEVISQLRSLETASAGLLPALDAVDDSALEMSQDDLGRNVLTDRGVQISAFLTPLEGGAVESSASNSIFMAGPGIDRFGMAGGGNLIFGTASELHNDMLYGFGETDLLLTLAEAFQRDALLPRVGSAIIGVDLLGDAVPDFEVRLEGVYDLDAFAVMPAPGGTAIFYRAAPPEVVATVEVAAINRAGNPMTDFVLHLERPFGTVHVTDANQPGNVAFDVLLGTEGQLLAVRAHAADDPAITASSALETLRMAVGLDPSWGPAGAMDFIAADFNGDGQVNAEDALEILRVAVGLPAAHEPRWLFVDSEADLSEVSRSNTQVEPGLRLAPITADTTDLSLTGILIGHLQEYA